LLRSVRKREKASPGVKGFILKGRSHFGQQSLGNHGKLPTLKMGQKRSGKGGRGGGGGWGGERRRGRRKVWRGRE